MKLNLKEKEKDITKVLLLMNTSMYNEFVDISNTTGYKRNTLYVSALNSFIDSYRETNV